MRRLTRDRLSRSLADARAQRNEATDSLSQLTFLRQADDGQPWALRGFSEDESLSFEPRADHHDPWQIGWDMTSVINPTMIVHDGDLNLFYRATPRKESLSSRIGHAVLRGETWDDAHTLAIVPETDDEVLGVEDPKIYRVDGRYVLFYNGIFEVDEGDRAAYPSPGYPVEEIGCEIKIAVSDDLISWTRMGSAVPREISRLWAKGAVIPRDSEGNAVRIGGEYLMYLSEGCNGVTHVGRSDDLITWTFAPQEYLDISATGGHLYEVATAFVADGHLILDYFFDEAGRWSAGQARYDLAAPFTQVETSPGGTLAWGGLITWQGRLSFMQGWDAPAGQAQLQFFAQ